MTLELFKFLIKNLNQTLTVLEDSGQTISPIQRIIKHLPKILIILNLIIINENPLRQDLNQLCWLLHRTIPYHLINHSINQIIIIPI